MSDGSVLLILGMLICIVLSAFFSASETAFTSANKVRLKALASKGNKKAKAVLVKLEDYDKLLSTILIGNNIVNISAATLGTILFVGLIGNAGATVSTIVVTVVILLFGEITPKMLANKSPEKVAMAIYTPLQLFIFVLTPINLIFMGWKWIVSKVFKSQDRPTVTEDELITYVEEAQSGGEIDAHESELIRSAIEFNDLSVSEILTPRVDVCAVEKKRKFEVIKDLFTKTGYSRLPVYDETIDEIIGIIHEKDLYALIESGKKDLKIIMSPVIHVAGDMKISALLRKLQTSKSHMAVVLDEFGGTKGIVTLEDILEELVGEIWDEHDEVVEYFKEIGDFKYVVVGNTDLSELFERLEVPAEASDFDAVSVSGWVIHMLEKIPEEGEEFDFKNIHVKVINADYKKVNEIEATIDPKYSEEQEDDSKSEKEE